MGGGVKFVDFGIPDAISYFGSVALPNIQNFETSPTIQFALNAVQSLWSMTEWHWYDCHRAQCSENTVSLPQFRARLFQECPEIKIVRDVAEAAKHCGLNRSSAKVKGMVNHIGHGGHGGHNAPTGGYGIGLLAYGSGDPQFMITLDNGDPPVWLPDLVTVVKNFWIKKLDFDREVISPKRSG